MSTEIATRTDDSLDGLSAGMNQLVQYTRVLEAADEFARRLARMAIAGPNYRGKPEDALGAILYGAELGLNPVQSLQQVFCVHGTPAIYARTMVALLKNRGFKFRTVETSDMKVTVTGTSPDGSTETATWTIERAITAGYVPVKDERTGKYKLNSNGKLDGNMKYLTDPQGMLYAKCAAEVSRKLAPDVLLGIAYTYEDLESEPSPVTVISERVEPSTPVSAADILGGVTDDESVAKAAASPPQPERAAEAEKAAPTPRKSRAKSATPAAEPEPSAGVPTVEQLTELAEVLNNEGLDTTEKKLDFLSSQLKRRITMPNQVRPDEVDELVGFLRAEQARDAADQEQAQIGDEQ